MGDPKRAKVRLPLALRKTAAFYLVVVIKPVDFPAACLIKCNAFDLLYYQKFIKFIMKGTWAQAMKLVAWLVLFIWFRQSRNETADFTPTVWTFYGTEIMAFSIMVK